MKTENRFKHEGTVFITLGLLLIAAALSLVLYNFYEEMQAKNSVSQVVSLLDECLPVESTEEALADSREAPEEADYEEEQVIPDYILAPQKDMPVVTVKGKDYIGILKIPSLELELPIMNAWNEDNLKVAPCRYMGSAYLNDLIICGHNYKSHFLRLRKLHEDDTVSFRDVDGNVFIYKVAAMEAIPATAPEEMESGDWDLTLFTCTVGGRTRDTIRCILVNCIPNTILE